MQFSSSKYDLDVYFIQQKVALGCQITYIFKTFGLQLSAWFVKNELFEQKKMNL